MSSDSMGQAEGRRPAHAVYAVLALLVATAFVYAPVRYYEFVSWDDGLMTLNPNVAHGLTWRSAWWAMTTGYAGQWIPLTWLSRLVDISLFGWNAGGHHLTNLLIHLANVALLFTLLWRMTGQLGRSWWVTAFFALHPLNVGSVAWVIERKGVLAATGFFLALWAYQAWVAKPRRSSYLVVVAMMCLSALAKPIVVTLPVVLLLLDVWPLRRVTLAFADRRQWMAMVREKVPLAMVAAFFAVIAFETERRAGVLPSTDMYPWNLRLANVLISYVRYIGKTIWPVDLAAFYPLRPFVLPDWLPIAAAALTLIGVSALVVRWARQRPYLLVGWCWYLVSLVPVIGLVQVSDASMADRFAYLPLIGLFVIVVWGVPELLSRVSFGRQVMYASAIAVVVSLAVDARIQLGYWQNSLALWGRSLDVAPEYNFRAHIGIGDALVNVGQLDEAVAQYREALRLLPGSAEAHNSLGVVLAQQDQLVEAKSEFNAAIRFNRSYNNLAQAHLNLGAVLARQGALPEAIAEYEIALRLDPDSPQAHYNLGLALAESGDLEAGVRECLTALRGFPNRADWEAGVARILAQLGRRDEAIEHLKAALVIDPTYEPARQVLEALNRR
ncbi:MAG: tetratricopeptide repeat protein [Acidobacteria bacterium]|nr:tetratricopeptide repeat protein [Acidobacteriota bacterium]